MSYIDVEFYKYIGIKLKEARLIKKHSLDYMGRIVGKTKKTIQRYERAEIRIDSGTLEKLCGVLGLNYNELLNYAKICSLNIEHLSFDDKMLLANQILNYINSLNK